MAAYNNVNDSLFGEGFNITDHLTTEVIQPSQWTDFQRHVEWTPEKRLFMEIFNRAVEDAFPKERQRKMSLFPSQVVQTEARAWIASDDDAEPFGFTRFCQVFAFDPEWLRKCIAERGHLISDEMSNARKTSGMECSFAKGRATNNQHTKNRIDPPRLTK